MRNIKLLLNMEKPSTKPKGTVNIFHFLSKPSSLVYITPHPPYSPRGAENTCTNKGFVVSLIPVEARVCKGKSSSGAEEEPTSPKVSCTGQIKFKKKKKQQQQQQPPLPLPLPLPCRTSSTTSTLHADRRENDRIFTENTERAKAPTVGVGEMRRFASGREGAAAALREFDWGKVERELKLDVENGGVLVKQGRKEVNLWKRRAMASRPVPLKVDK